MSNEARPHKATTLREDELAGPAEVIVQSLLATGSSNPLGPVAEGFAKVVSLEALLARGFSIVESRPGRAGAATLLRLASYGYALEVCRDQRFCADVAGARQYADIRIAEPRAFVHIKTFGSVGSKSAAATNGLAKDIERLRNDRSSILVLFAHYAQYARLHGRSLESRGRPQDYSNVLAVRSVLPPPAGVGAIIQYSSRSPAWTDTQSFRAYWGWTRNPKWSESLVAVAVIHVDA